MAQYIDWQRMFTETRKAENVGLLAYWRRWLAWFSR